MRAVVYEGPGRVTCRQVPDPIFNGEGAMLHVDAATVCGTDVRTIRYGNKAVNPPWILGHEVVGTILEIERTALITKGQRVLVIPSVHCGVCEDCLSGRSEQCPFGGGIGYKYPGGFAEYLAVGSQWVRFLHLVALPDDNDPVIYALSEPLGCVLRAHRRAGTRLGDGVVVLGSGAIGIMHCVTALLRGAAWVIVYDPITAKSAMAAEFVPQVKTATDEETLMRTVRDLSRDQGADVVITANSSPASPTTGLNLLGQGGRLVVFGGIANQKLEGTGLNLNDIHYGHKRVIGTAGASIRDIYHAIHLIKEKKVPADKLISHRFPLESFPEALMTIEQGVGLRIAIQP